MHVFSYSDATLKPIPHREMALASARRAGWGHHAISCVLEAKERTLEAGAAAYETAVTAVLQRRPGFW